MGGGPDGAGGGGEPGETECMTIAAPIGPDLWSVAIKERGVREPVAEYTVRGEGLDRGTFVRRGEDARRYLAEIRRAVEGTLDDDYEEEEKDG